MEPTKKQLQEKLMKFLEENDFFKKETQSYKELYKKEHDRNSFIESLQQATVNENISLKEENKRLVAGILKLVNKL